MHVDKLEVEEMESKVVEVKPHAQVADYYECSESDDNASGCNDCVYIYFRVIFLFSVSV